MFNLSAKQAAAAAYSGKIKGLDQKEWKNDSIVGVFGCAPGNIGEKISQSCPSETMNCTGYTIEQIRIPALPMEVIENCNGFVFTNSVNHLDWIEDWPAICIDDVIDNSMTSTIKAISQIAKAKMFSGNRTKIIIIGSMAHKAVLNGSSPYCAAKAGIQHFVRCVAYELAPKGFEVFCVNPSNVQGTPMSVKTIEGLARYRQMSTEQAEAYWGAECPMGSFLSSEEVSDVVWDLLVNNRRYLSGSAIDLIGGQR